MRRRVAVTLWVFPLLLLASGCVGEGPVLADEVPPSIADVQVSRERLTYLGGTVFISARVTDPSGVHSVWAVVRRPDGSEERADFRAGSGGLYEGQLTLRPNTRSDGQAEEYQVWVLARDLRGNQTQRVGDGIRLTVTAPSRPPTPPSL
ncbi:MAG: hypothetical protein NZ959_10230 [Armatimonadetes bacterium]|nr:hypothetical protein [Armatimonadota bacterium]MDW8123026.1 hypothetical protein [Armatimonadota bacterium]